MACPYRVRAANPDIRPGPSRPGLARGSDASFGTNVQCFLTSFIAASSLGLLIAAIGAVDPPDQQRVISGTPGAGVRFNDMSSEPEL